MPDRSQYLTFLAELLLRLEQEEHVFLDHVRQDVSGALLNDQLIQRSVDRLRQVDDLLGFYSRARA